MLATLPVSRSVSPSSTSPPKPLIVHASKLTAVSYSLSSSSSRVSASSSQTGRPRKLSA